MMSLNTVNPVTESTGKGHTATGCRISLIKSWTNQKENKRESRKIEKEYLLSERNLITVLWIAGALAIAYGMLRENHFVFIPGIVMVVAGYIMVRKHLKRSVDKEKNNKITP